MLTVKKETIDIVRRLIPEISMIENKDYRESVERIWAYAFEKSHWDKLEDACFEPGMPEVSLIGHVRVATLGAVHMVDLIYEIQNIKINRQYVLIAALLHDVSKLDEYEPDEEHCARISDLGKKVQHSVYGAHLMLDENLPIDLVHSVVSHTPQSNIRPFTLDAIIVQYLDHCDARILFNNKYTCSKFPALKK